MNTGKLDFLGEYSLQLPISSTLASNCYQFVFAVNGYSRLRGLVGRIGHYINFRAVRNIEQSPLASVEKVMVSSATVVNAAMKQCFLNITTSMYGPWAAHRKILRISP
ncbi:MAG: hypothetical protein AABZ06_14175 [Bdellovibrionota bacterium]